MMLPMPLFFRTVLKNTLDFEKEISSKLHLIKTKKIVRSLKEK